MDINPLTRSLNLPATPVVPSNTPAAEEVERQAAETAKVTPPPASGDAASHGGTSGQPGLGTHVDLYDTHGAQMAAEKNAQSATQAKAPAPPDQAEADKPEKKLHLLGKGTGLPEPADPPPNPEFPFLSPLGSAKTGQVVDTKV